jgi:hypothetical protein
MPCYGRGCASPDEASTLDDGAVKHWVAIIAPTAQENTMKSFDEEHEYVSCKRAQVLGDDPALQSHQFRLEAGLALWRYGEASARYIVK